MEKDAAQTTQTEVQAQPESLLPRTAWKSQLTWLRLVYRTKLALDRIEQSK